MINKNPDFYISILRNSAVRFGRAPKFKSDVLNDLSKVLNAREIALLEETMAKLLLKPVLWRVLKYSLSRRGLKTANGHCELLQLLASFEKLIFMTGNISPIATLVPGAAGFTFNDGPLIWNKKYKLSRFVYMHKDGGSDIVLETPKSVYVLYMHNPIGLYILYFLFRGASPAEISFDLADDTSQIAPLFQLLLIGGFIDPLVDGDNTTEELDQALIQWEFHDLLFHARTRLGRHNHPIGSHKPFIGKILPQPAVKPIKSRCQKVRLYKPKISKSPYRDATFTRIFESRRSLRSFGANPISLKSLGEFLYRSARIRSRVTRKEYGQITSRPYPNSGALYEVEIYLAINKCRGLERGLYYYDALNHRLIRISKPVHDFERVLEESKVSCSLKDKPQVLVILASRFQRISWKYQGIAYALMLKNVGALLATTQLVATAMGLAHCPIGTGNSDRFSRLTGCSYYEESSIGEFVLGSREVLEPGRYK
jgi:oxazoline/thiazoline dehydrogenase